MFPAFRPSGDRVLFVAAVGISKSNPDATLIGSSARLAELLGGQVVKRSFEEAARGGSA
jgi:hypothetical protein